MAHMDKLSGVGMVVGVREFTRTALPVYVGTDGFPLSDVASDTGLSEQMIVNLIRRYDIIKPVKRRRNNRDIYIFTPWEYEILQQIQDFVEEGYLLGQAVEAVRKQAIFREHIDAVRQALGDWLYGTDNPEMKNNLISAITVFLRATDEQIATVFAEYYTGGTLFESGIEANLNGQTRKQIEKAARIKLQEADCILGALLTSMLKESDLHASLTSQI